MLEFKSHHSANCTQTLILAPQNKRLGGSQSKFGFFNRQPYKVLLLLITHKNIFNHGSGSAEESQTNIYSCLLTLAFQIKTWGSNALCLVHTH